MTNIKDAAPDLAHQKRLDKTEQRKAGSSHSNHSIPTEGKQVAAFLRTGRKNAVSSADLITLLDLSSQRELRALVSREREAGEIILSDSSGYYLPASGEEGLQEIRECVMTLMAKGFSTIKAARAIWKPLRDVYGQLGFDDIVDIVKEVKQ